MKQEEKSRQSCEMIINAAIEEFSSTIYEKTSLNRICQKHHISKGKIYHHFESKDALFVACLNYAVDKAIEHSILDEYDGKELDKKFHNLFSSRQNFIMQKPHSASFLYRTFKNPPEHLQEDVTKCRLRFREAVANMLISAFSPFPWFQEEQLPYFTEIFVLASNRVHEVGLENWNPNQPFEKRKQLMEKNIALFDKLIHIFLYGILPRDNEN